MSNIHVLFLNLSFVFASFAFQTPSRWSYTSWQLPLHGATGATATSNTGTSSNSNTPTIHPLLSLGHFPTKKDVFRKQFSSALYSSRGKDTMNNEELKVELTKYLNKRKEVNADASAKKEVGKIVGGTKGNAVLEFISGSPNKEKVIEDVPDIFDYSELEKYGFNYLATPIMNAGGRSEMYNLMGMVPPKPKARVKQSKKAPELVIDREGKNDKARYSGLKVSQVIDDDALGRKLEEALRKQKEGKDLREKLQEEKFEAPFADKRNTSPNLSPDWTPERLDEEGRRAGQAISWARKARSGEFKKDPYELLNIEGGLQIYSIITTPFVALSFGSATTKMFEMLNINVHTVDVLQPAALAVIVASLGSSIFCALTAPSKNRSAFIWAIKGYAGGPVAVVQLRSLNRLITRGEAEQDRGRFVE